MATWCLCLLLITVSPWETTSKVIDLSHDHGPDTLMSPHVPHFNRSTIFAGDYVPGVYVEGGQYFSGEHGGTHMDAPVHFQKGGIRIHQVPLESTIADGVMIDCRLEAAANKSYLVPVQKLLDWEAKYGPIPQEAAVLFYFGWGQKFHDKVLYLGTESEDQFQYVFPSLSPEAGYWLSDNRNIKILGSDTITPDAFSLHGRPTGFPIHQRYLPKGRLVVENLRISPDLPPRGFRFHAAPVKYVGATGTQVRAYAMTYESDLESGAAPGPMCGLVVMVVVVVGHLCRPGYRLG